MVDFGAGVKLDGVAPDEFSDRLIVINQGFYQKMLGYGAQPETIVLTSTAYLECLSKIEPPAADSGVLRVTVKRCNQAAPVHARKPGLQ